MCRVSVPTARRCGIRGKFCRRIKHKFSTPFMLAGYVSTPAMCGDLMTSGTSVGGLHMNAELVIRDATTERNGGMATVVFASSVGTIIEWYDFFIYGTAAALVFNSLFFPNIDPLAGTLASLATYSVGFVARPIGGAIFGHFGDRIGRKIMLMITMVIMALGTFVVGCLPTYQQIGVWAPILLVILRFIQGIGL